MKGMGVRRRYTDDERAACLAALSANGGNVERTAADCGVPETTLRQWSKGTRHVEASQMSGKKKKDLGTKLNELAHKLAGAMPGKIKDANLRDLAVSMGVAIDKSRLLSGQPTNINENRLMPDLSRLSDDDLDNLKRITRRALEPGLDHGGGVAAGANGVPEIR
jgi:transposase-like protein